MSESAQMPEGLAPRLAVLGRHTFMEVSGEALRFASKTAVLALRTGAGEQPFDVTVRARRGQRVLTPGADETWIAAGVADAYRELRASPTVVAASGQWPPTEVVVQQPIIIDLRQATSGDPHRYEISYLSADDASPRGVLFQETKATLNPISWVAFLRTHVVPSLRGFPRPFRVALAVGGTSAEASLGTAASADAGDLDHLYEVGDEAGTPIRQRALEAELAALLEEELGGQGPDPVCSQIRIIRLVRHGGSLPIGLYVGLPGDRHSRVTLSPLGLDVSPMGSARGSPPPTGGQP